MLTTFNEVDMSAVMALRERHKEAFKKQSRCRPRHRLVLRKAPSRPCAEFPRINAEIQGDEMVLKHYYDIGIAVGGGRPGRPRPARRGPHVVRRDRTEPIRDFATRQDGSLTLEDLTGGTFSITNGGVYGSL